jgi:hypothetical protein
MIATTVAELPALPLHTAGKYVAGAYIVLFALVLVYVAIMAIRLSRIERELGELLDLSAGPRELSAGPGERPAAAGGTQPDPAVPAVCPLGQDDVAQPESTLA